MPQITSEKCVLLAKKIEKILINGLNLSNDVLHYIDSTFSNPSVKELEALINDASDCEKDSLLELIFFPDESVQVQLEEILERHDFQKQDNDRVINCLLLQPPETMFYFSDNRGVLKILMPDWVAEQFISRLNISKKLDKRLAQAIKRHVSEKYRQRFKVMLRNTRFVPTENKTLFLCRFFENTDAESDDIIRQLNFILEFLDELRDDRDIFQSLADKKRFCFQHLQNLVKFEEQLQKTNMETLILQGVRSPYTSRADMLEKITIIDTVCLSIFGKTAYSSPDYGSLDLGEYYGEADMERMIRTLS